MLMQKPREVLSEFGGAKVPAVVASAGGGARAAILPKSAPTQSTLFAQGRFTGCPSWYLQERVQNYFD